MDFPIKNALAALAVALACARSFEQLLPAVRNRWFGLAPVFSPQVSKLSPFAGAAALAYGHAIGADTALLIATWLHTATAMAVVAITPLHFRPELEGSEAIAQEITHD